MNLYFNIHYKTNFGEELAVSIVCQNKNEGGTTTSEHRMNTLDGQQWTLRLNIDDPDTIPTHYHYSVVWGERTIRREWSLATHHIEQAPRHLDYTLYDRWIDIPSEPWLYTSAFTNCLNSSQDQPSAESPAPRADSAIILKVRAPQLPADQSLLLTGSQPALGAWNLSKSIKMTRCHNNEWTAQINPAILQSPKLEFKFAAIGQQTQEVNWEQGPNRTINLPDTIFNIKVGVNPPVLVYELTPSTFEFTPVKCAGTLIPVFSLRSRDSFGVGDFGDLKKMVGWVARTKQRVLQILPINDTTITHTWTDSYPYSAISVFALHPQFTDLNALPPLADQEQRQHFEQIRQELNDLPQVDYERVNQAKNAYLRLLFQQEGKQVMRSKPYKEFFSANQQWLAPYALYCHLRDTHHTADFSQWPHHNTWDESLRPDLLNPRSKAHREVAFYYYVQFILNRQMEDVHQQARQLHVILKGDIPIGVNRHSCDVWQEPRYFNLNAQAGAPPDDFSANGQNWGFPTYNWPEMLKDQCLWWQRRFQNMAKYFDAYRIDHVLGFFRIWEIPQHAVHGLLGQFAPSLGMTREEIQAYGLHFQEELFTTPFITDWVLNRMFGETEAQAVKAQFLQPKGDGYYRMRTEFNTQKKIEQWHHDAIENAAEADTRKLDNLRDSLYALISDVLFLPDHRNPNLFHPRITAQYAFIYESLYDSDKHVFNRIYNDYFYRRNNQFWYREAMKKLPALVQATPMLACAEDLGMVPDCVPWVMNELHILSLEIQSMPKSPNLAFGQLANNPYTSVATISTHDMPTLRQWWDQDTNRTQAYYNNALHLGGPAPHPLSATLARDIVSAHLNSPSMLCVLALQDWLATNERLRHPQPDAERVNIPANPKHYWRYRMHLNIEDLDNDDLFNQEITQLVAQSGRA